MPDPLVWLDGQLLPASQLRIDPSDRGFLLGDGLFETLLAQAGRAPLFDRHLARLASSAEALGIPLPWTAHLLERATRELLLAKGLAAGLAALRITLSAGPGPRGLLRPSEPRPSLLITAAPQDPRPPRPARLILASTPVAAASPLRRHKSLSYLESVLARREAAAAGADEALLLNTAGHVVEASAANIFLWQDGALWTPPVDDGALPGITRGLVLELARAEGLAAGERSLGLDDLATAEAVFLTSSLIGMRPVAGLRGLPETPDIVWTDAGPVIDRLRRAHASKLGLPGPL